MAKRRHILFTGGGGAGNEALYSLLGDTYDLYFGDADPSAICPKIPSQKKYRLPFASEDGFAEELARICRSLAIDLLIPGVDEELVRMGGVATAAPGCRILIPDEAYVRLALNKYDLAQALREKDIAVPRTVYPGKEPWPSCPFIAKPVTGRGSRGVRLIRSEKEARAYLELAECDGIDLIFQELVEGTEYTVMMAAGQVRDLQEVVPVRVFTKRGITISAMTDDNSNVIRACRAIHDAIPACGCYNIQLIQTSDGRVLPFEINPRISTTFCLGIRAGVNPIEVFFDPNYRSSGYSSGVRLQRYWHNNFLE